MLIKLLTAATLAMAAGAASAGTLDFDGLASNADNFVYIGPIYVEDGFEITADQGGLFTPGSEFLY